MDVKKPKLIVFDLDNTLWPSWVHLREPPFKKDFLGRVRDSNGYNLSPYPQVPNILKKLNEDGYILAVASRSDIEKARPLIHVFGWDKMIKFKQIYGERKTLHFFNLRKKSGIPFDEMLFFDDEKINVSAAKDLGITSVLVINGLTTSVLNYGLSKYAKEHPQLPNVI